MARGRRRSGCANSCRGAARAFGCLGAVLGRCQSAAWPLDRHCTLRCCVRGGGQCPYRAGRCRHVCGQTPRQAQSLRCRPGSSGGGIMTREATTAMRLRLENTAQPLSYDEAKKFLMVEDTVVRRLLASRRDVPQEVLYYLAQDAAPEVRMAVASNPETPIQAELLLSRDASEEVRLALAGKVAQVANERSADERPGRAKLFFELLKALARDELARIRRVVSQAVKDIANIPRDIVRLLASDPDPEVAAPVLKDSPVLRERDLILAIEANPAAEVVGAVAQRADLGAALSDAVVATGSESGIAALLANESAQIREETLDLLIEQAAAVPAWQESLVERPKLSARAATRLAHVVAAPLAEKLARR